eukprot:scaffold85707_cov17-Prasinocladus_malaysianus.AAC.1
MRGEGGGGGEWREGVVLVGLVAEVIGEKWVEMSWVKSGSDVWAIEGLSLRDVAEGDGMGKGLLLQEYG